MGYTASGKDHWHYKHGMKNTRIYSVWKGIKYRCNTPTCKNYEHYGGRGIKICPEWDKDFMAFYKWAIENGYDETAPRGVCTIEREDTDGDYCPENCLIVTIREQENNRTNNHFVEYDGVIYTLSQLERQTGVPQRFISKHLLRGRDIYEIIEHYKTRKGQRWD